jgi:hypothetical protein
MLGQVELGWLGGALGRAWAFRGHLWWAPGYSDYTPNCYLLHRRGSSPILTPYMDDSYAVAREYHRDGFIRDVAWSIGALREHPLLLVLAVGFWLLTVVRVDGSAGLLVAGGVIVALGFEGTARVWFVRASRGRTLAPREVVTFTLRFLGRFFLLALIGLVFLVPLTAVLVGAGLDPRVAQAGAGIPIDATLTFVLPALACSTRSVTIALKDGLSSLVRWWPSGWPYVLAPAVICAIPALIPNVLISGCVIGALHIVMIGAVMAFFLRRVDVGDDGAVAISRTQRGAG